jgi:excisionase family DNA binding protein
MQTNGEMYMKQSEATGQGGDLLRVNEAAALLNVKPATIRAWIMRRKITFVRLSLRAVRVRRADIEKIISQGLVGARQ